MVVRTEKVVNNEGVAARVEKAENKERAMIRVERVESLRLRNKLR